MMQCPHLCTAVAWREKVCKHFVFYKYFCLILGLLKSRISKKSFEGLGRKPDFKHLHCKARVQWVSKITTIAARNRCQMYNSTDSVQFVPHGHFKKKKCPLLSQTLNYMVSNQEKPHLQYFTISQATDFLIDGRRSTIEGI